MKLKNIKAFEEFFYFDQEEERASNERPETDGCPDCGDDVVTCDCVDYDDEEFGPDYVKPSNREEEIYGDDDDYDNNFELAPVGEEDSEYDEEEEEEDDTNKPWGDEGIRLERFSTFNEKKKAPKKDKKEDEKDPKKPDFKDFDKDGDKKEPMAKALKDKEAKEDKGGKKFEKPKKGEIPAALAAYQKKKKK